MLQQAHGGTLCLKDIDRLPLRLARMVLQVIRYGTVRRMKGTEVEPADIWLIGTSHTRVSVFRPFRPIVLTTPPLRERGDDVLLLAPPLPRRIWIKVRRAREDALTERDGRAPRSRLAAAEHVGVEKRDGARLHPDRAAAARAGGSGIVPGATLTIARDGIERALRGRVIPSSNSPLLRGAPSPCTDMW